MKKARYTNLGIPIAVGDIITTYHKGYWRLVKINRRYLTKRDLEMYHEAGEYKYKKVGDEYSPIFVYEQVMTDSLKPVTRKSQKECDASFCQKVTKDIITKMQADFNEGCKQLAALLK